MLQLRFQEILPKVAGRVRLRDVTGNYDAGLNPGGYGGDNPLRAEIAVLGLLGRLLPGAYEFDLTLHPEFYAPEIVDILEFEVPGNSDGVYQLFAFAAPLTAPLGEGELGYVVAERALFKASGVPGGIAVLLQLDSPTLTLDEWRSAEPVAVPLAESTTAVLHVDAIQQGLDESLLDFTGTEDRSVKERDARERWLTGETSLAAVQLLYKNGRLPEASQHLAALRRQLFGGLPPGSIAPTQINSWKGHA